MDIRIREITRSNPIGGLHTDVETFVYFITVVNNSSERVRIIGRKWIVREQDGETTVVEGDGVVGQTPILEPGEDFSYNSYHVVADSASAQGALFGKTADESSVVAVIPEFNLDLPDWA